MRLRGLDDAVSCDALAQTLHEQGATPKAPTLIKKS